MHINASVAGLVPRAMVLGKNVSAATKGSMALALTLTMVRCVDAVEWAWFGFNAGSNLESTAGAKPGLHQHPVRNGRCGAGRGARPNPVIRQGLDAGYASRCGGWPGGDHPGLRQRLLSAPSCSLLISGVKIVSVV